ncbi:hypothetical protein [Kitasatospora sp. NPDC002965]|uniref:hypothetical protein n=1 Tax=Kitasatospora sp. NPDC002965 TaxID=3154775 RepID=UPI0033B7832A
MTTMVTLYGGPLDGASTPVDPDDPDPWVAVISEGCAFPGGRSVYEPDEGGRWTWVRDLPWEAL